MRKKYVLEEVQRGSNSPIAWSENRNWLDYVARRKSEEFPATFNVREMDDNEQNIPRVGTTVKIVQS